VSPAQPTPPHLAEALEIVGADQGLEVTAYGEDALVVRLVGSGEAVRVERVSRGWRVQHTDRTESLSSTLQRARWALRAAPQVRAFAVRLEAAGVTSTWCREASRVVAWRADTGAQIIWEAMGAAHAPAWRLAGESSYLSEEGAFRRTLQELGLELAAPEREYRESLISDTALADLRSRGVSAEEPATAVWCRDRAVTINAHGPLLDHEQIEQMVARMVRKEEARTTMATTILTDAEAAAQRTAARQLVKLVREPLVGVLQRHLAPGDEAMRAKLAAFLETELGTALLAAALSTALSSMPRAPARAELLARELRVQSMADAGDVLADVLMGPLRQVVAAYLQDAPVAPALPSGEGVERLETAEAREVVR